MPTLRRSAVLAAPIGAVWAVLRDFNSHHRWHPAIVDSAIEHFAPPDQVGCVRSFLLRDGHRLREQLLSLSDGDHAMRYCILSSTLPLRDYVAVLRLLPVVDTGQTFCLWEGRFQAPSGLAEIVARDVYESGLAGLRAHLSGPGPA